MSIRHPRPQAARRIALVVMQQIDRRVDAVRPGLESLTETDLTPIVVGEIQALVVQRVIESAPEVQPHVEAFLEDRLGVADLVEGKLIALPKPEFERVLRRVFEEEEITLVVIGGVLGGLAGALQGALTFAL